MPRFDRLATLYLSFPLTCFLGPRQRTRVPMLMYHSISDYLFAMSHPYYHINTLPQVCVSMVGGARAVLADARLHRLHERLVDALGVADGVAHQVLDEL